MNRDDDGRYSLIVEFTVRNDKWRGILIEKFSTESNEYFFKYHDQSIQRHCAQLQRIVRVADVKQTKKITVDISKYQFEYFKDGVATFKGCKLNSVNSQIMKVCQLTINKEIGSAKRSRTVAQNKQRKIEQHNVSISSKMAAAQDFYTQQREIRMRAFRGSGDQVQNPESGPSKRNPTPPPLPPPVSPTPPPLPPPVSPQSQSRQVRPIIRVAPLNQLPDIDSPTGRHVPDEPIAPEIAAVENHDLGEPIAAAVENHDLDDAIASEFGEPSGHQLDHEDQDLNEEDYNLDDPMEIDESMGLQPYVEDF